MSYDLQTCSNFYYCCADNIEVAYLKTLTKDDIIQFYKVSQSCS